MLAVAATRMQDVGVIAARIFQGIAKNSGRVWPQRVSDKSLQPPKILTMTKKEIALLTQLLRQIE
jgi:hypothetical protein